MNVKVSWKQPLALELSSEKTLIYSTKIKKIPKSPGIYIFARRWKNTFEALYVGRTQNLQGRINGHFKSLPLMKFIENSKSGEKVVFIGTVIPAPGQNLNKVLRIAEQTYIRHFLADGHDLANQLGTKIRRHEIISEGKIYKSFIPTSMYLERK